MLHHPVLCYNLVVDNIQSILEQYQGEEIRTINMTSDSLWSKVIIVNCKNKRHIHTMADKVTQYLKRNEKIIPNIEGKAEQDDNWVIVDAEDTLIHFFSPEARRFYDLEGILLSTEANASGC